MSKAENEKRRVNPGLVRSSSKYGRTKPSSNPTMQLAVVALPSAEKDSTFKEKYADSLTLSWVPTSYEEVINIQSAAAAEPGHEAERKPDNKYIQKAKKSKDKPEEKLEKVEKVQLKPAERIPSDMEVVMSAAIPDVTPKAKDIVPELIMADIPAAQPVEENVFDAINSMPVVEEKKEETKRDSFVDLKPFMVVDKVEIRKTTNSEGEEVYMTGKKINTAEEFGKYLQSVYGKLLAGDCKHLEYDGRTFVRQSGGMYRDNEGNQVTADDIISILNS